MIDEDTGSCDGSVPTRLLTVLYDVILVTVAGVVIDVSIATVNERLHVCNIAVFIENDGVNPSCCVALVSCVADRLETVTVVVTRAHEVPCSHTVLAAIVDIVKIRIAKAVRELVADGTDTSHIALAVLQLVRASIYVNCGAVLAESCGLGELRLVRPDGICATTSSLTLTSVDYVNLFHLTVTIPVVLLEVYTCGSC